ncbi:MAG TPA: hypothetical protein VEF34_01230 [Syntrophobacteraceae bacterium]|nr:hypothetical protein [Syntrophobacteraceae bacterium]
MESFFAPPMPFHPEELYKHIRHLEQVYNAIPPTDGNARTAMAKAIISATASFVEGCVDDLITFTLAAVGVPPPILEWVKGRRRLRGLDDKIQLLKSVLAGLRAGWQVKESPASQFIEGPMPDNKPGLRQLRNKVDHGSVVEQADLRVDRVAEFRILACEYLVQVYASMNVGTPGWLRN